MSSKKPVVVYGASGYTGRLVCEFLRHYKIPFTAAGRNAAKLEEVMKSVPGIETADYDVVQVDNTEESLTELLEGRKVVCNVVGPFERYGEPVVRAALNTGCHYIDTTGEPAYANKMIEKYSQAFKEKGISMCPYTAYMYVPAEICARTIMDQDPTIDNLEVATAGNFLPTHASVQSIFSLFSHDAQYLKDNEMVNWPAGRGYEVNVPGWITTQLVHPWGGGFLPTVFKDHPTVHTCKQYSGNADRATMEMAIEMQKDFEANVRTLATEEERQAAIDARVESVEYFLPPRENPLENRSVDMAVGIGSAGGLRAVLQSTTPYTMTGLFQAATAAMLAKGGTQKPGFASACEAVGHNYLLAQLKNFVPAKLTITDI
ncbi:DUF5938 domain-containing protein [Thalassotalea nanhaiensis]|uniref:DUF5938 domain-containing protein n=1 Tax=Thalassotalea nanhaiensis TaxID=3065648 RepID=A0ABY9TE26_9GAMM|nr:DUF5938 domain-containing protein [Colwelliaceae bacterium SQ345]